MNSFGASLNVYRVARSIDKAAYISEKNARIWPDNTLRRRRPAVRFRGAEALCGGKSKRAAYDSLIRLMSYVTAVMADRPL